MWSEALEQLQSAERLQRQFFQIGADGARWEPPVDVYQTDEDLWIFLAVPGVPADHVEVVVDGTTLIVRGERPLPPAARGAIIHRLEIPYGQFERRIALPSGHYQVLQRLFDNGCLVLGLRKLT
jgi:HSP20 family molecular chaperone IbpA